jgi:hypothetical protein
MLKNLLRDKDNEVEHYRKTAETIAAQAGGEIKVPPPPPSTTRPEEAAEAGGAEAGDERTDEESDPSADARVSLAVKALRLERRNKELVGKVRVLSSSPPYLMVKQHGARFFLFLRMLTQFRWFRHTGAGRGNDA